MTQLRDLMDRAVATAPPETWMPQDLLDAARRDLRRRQTWMSVGAAAILVVVVGLAWSVAALLSDRQPPVMDNPVPGTPGALVAVALQHADIEVNNTLGGRGGDHFPVGSVWASMYVAEPGLSSPAILTLSVVTVEPDDGTFLTCARADGCAEIETRRGTVDLLWYEHINLSRQGVVVLTAHRGDEWARVAWTGQGFDGDPRDADLTVSVDDLVAIVDDPRFGLETSADAVEQGSQLIPE